MQQEFPAQPAISNWKLRHLVLTEQNRAEVPLARIWQQNDNTLAGILLAGGNLNGCPYGSTGRNTYQQTFLSGQLTTRTKSVIVGHGDDFVDYRSIIRCRNKAGTDTLEMNKPAEEDTQISVTCPTNARDSTARAGTGNKNIYGTIGVLPDFLSGGVVMAFGISHILELLKDDCTRRHVTDNLSSLDSTCHPFAARRQTDVGTISGNKFSALYTHRLGHRQDEVVAFHGTHQSQSYPGIAARRLYNGGARLQQPATFGVFYHRQSDTVFHATTRIEELYFCNDRRGKALPRREQA